MEEPLCFVPVTPRLGHHTFISVCEFEDLNLLGDRTPTQNATANQTPPSKCRAYHPIINFFQKRKNVKVKLSYLVFSLAFYTLNLKIIAYKVFIII